MIRRLIASAVLAFTHPAGAAVPAANYTDMWWNPSESGWGVSIVQHGGTDQVYAVWYTYDPRERDSSTGQFKPLWLVMAGGSWVTPTTLTGPVYVTNGRPFHQSGSSTTVTNVGSFTFSFANTSSGTFTYNIAPPANVAATDPAFNLPPLSGSKSITRQGF